MKERMEMLLEAGVITQHSHDVTLRATNMLVQDWEVDAASEHIQMAMTHFARAVDRIKTNQAVTEGLDSEIIHEIIEDEIYPEVIAMNEKICQLAEIAEVPESENSFFLSNLYSIKINQ